MLPEPVTNPPIFTAIMVTNFFAIAFGFIFKDMLEYQVAKWNLNRDTQAKIHYRTANTVIAYAGLTLFVWLCMGASLSVFGWSLLIAHGIAAIVVFPTMILIWLQMGTMLELLARGGSAAIDIDSLS